MVQTCEKIERSACEEGDNLDYQPTYEDFFNNDNELVLQLVKNMCVTLFNGIFIKCEFLSCINA